MREGGGWGGWEDETEVGRGGCEDEGGRRVCR